MTGIPRWTERYSGIPFVNRGFDRDGCHCWGLARLAIGEQAGIWLPTYGEIAADELVAIAHAMKSERCSDAWREVASWQPFDVVLMAGRVLEGERRRRTEVHCGVAVSSDHLMHVEEMTATVCVRRDHPSVKFRILETYRNAQLA